MKRFYKNVSVVPGEGGFQVLLDGRGVKTPAGKSLALPTQSLADAIAGEWRTQGDVVEPTSMPLLRLANTAIDGIAANRDQTIAAILRFGENDLLCYRADAPPALVRRQSEGWDRWIAWADRALGAKLTVVDGLTHADQPAAAMAALGAAVARQDDFALAGLHVIASVTGSLVLGLAVAMGELSAADAFALSRIDEAHQAETWGTDAEAEARAASLATEVGRAAQLVELSR
jgi:chaperone required for assembly of F1-ATPase